MKYYSEDDTRELRLALEGEIFTWKEVSKKKRFGCPCYQAKGRLFVFLVTKGIVITQLQPADIGAISRLYESSFFKAGKKIVSKWPRIPLRDKEDLEKLMPFVRRSYEEALLKE